MGHNVLKSNERVDLWIWLKEQGGENKHINKTHQQIAQQWNTHCKTFQVNAKHIKTGCDHWGITVPIRQRTSFSGYRKLEEKIAILEKEIINLGQALDRIRDNHIRRWAVHMDTLHRNTECKSK